MITISVNASGPEAGLQRLRRGLANREQLHARIAVDALELTKVYVSGLPFHKTANRLGATPTGHFGTVASQIESSSDASGATIGIPRASRLRAAFGDYDVVPGPGFQFLPIAYDAEAYGRRPREMNLEFSIEIVTLPNGYVGPMRVLIKKDAPLQVMFTLIRKAHIKQDRRLLPFDEYAPTAQQTAEDYIAELANGKEPS